MHKPVVREQRQLPDVDELQSLLECALQAARANGATAAAAGTGASRALQVRVRQGETEAVEFQADRELDITVYRGQHKGSATTTDLSRKAIEQAAAQACAIACHTGADQWAGLADAERMATYFPALDLSHPWEIDVDAAVELARQTEAAALAVDARITNSEGAEVDTSTGISAYANSHGFFGHHDGTHHGLSCAVIAREGEQMQRDYWYSTARDAQALEGAVSIGQRAGQRAIARLGAVTPATTRAPVLFPPRLARSLFGHFLGAISGGALYRDASFLKGCLGEKIFSSQVQLVQRPHLRTAMGSACFDAEGVATVDRDLIADGVLQGYLLGSYSARRLGMQTTGNAGGVFNLLVEPGTQEFAALLRQMGSGLLVNELMGQGVNLMTGDYSRGASGFWVENGKIAYPVQNVTVASRLQDMYAGIVALGNDVDDAATIRTPSVLLEAMTIAGS